MTRAALAAIVVATSLAAAFGAIAFFSSRDDATTNSGGAPVAAPGDPARTPGGLDELLRAGNVVIEHPARSDGGPPVSEAESRALQALAEEVTGGGDLPALRRAGQAIEVRASVGVRQIVAYAWQRQYVTNDPADPRLREFVEHWLGRGG